MRLPFFIVLGLLLGSGGLSTSCFAQKPQGDSVDLSETAKRAMADALFFDAQKAKMRDDDKEAARLLEEYVEKKPGVAAAYFDLARISRTGKDIPKATSYIKKAIDADKSNRWYKEEYAGILADGSSYTDAAGIAADLSKEYPNEQIYLLMTAEYYEKAQKYKEALSYIDKALVRTGNDEDVLLRKVQLCLSLNDVDQAAITVEQLIVKSPREGKYYKLLGELYDNNKFPDKALQTYNKALKLIPDDASVQLGLAEHYLKAGDTAAYKTYLKKAIVNKDVDVNAQIDFLKAYIQSAPDEATSVKEGLPIVRELMEQHPEDASVWAFYGDFLEAANEHDSAIAAYKKALAIKPAAFTVWRNLLSMYTEKPQADSLIKYSEKFMKLFPTQAIASYFNGIGYFNKKDYAKAIKSLNRAIDMQPDNDKQMLSAMYSAIADVYHANNQDDMTDKSFEKAMQLVPADPTVMNNYAYNLSERGKKLDEAEKMSKHSLDLRPNEPTYLDTYGWILYKQGSYSKAKEYIQKAIDLSGAKADGTLYDHLGNICYKLNEKDKAVQYWKTAKEKGSDNPVLDKKIAEGKIYE